MAFLNYNINIMLLVLLALFLLKNNGHGCGYKVYWIYAVFVWSREFVFTSRSSSSGLRYRD